MFGVGRLVYYWNAGWGSTACKDSALLSWLVCLAWRNACLAFIVRGGIFSRQPPTGIDALLPVAWLQGQVSQSTHVGV